jgi:hypothetical protein
MNTNDAKKSINEFVKMFADSVASKQTNIGFIAYTDQISAEFPLTSMQNASDREALKTAIDAAPRGGSTDIGMALKYGAELLGKTPASNKKVMILFSDGETDLNGTKTGRTLTVSVADENAAYDKANAMDCPIYTVGVSKNGGLNTEYLTKIADETGGSAFESSGQTDLLVLFAEIFENVIGNEIVLKGETTGTGGLQSLEIPIAGGFVGETNVLLRHNSPIKVVSLDNANYIYESAGYTAIKIEKSEKNSAVIGFLAVNGDELRVAAVNYIEVFPVILPIQDFSKAVFPIEVKLQNLDGANLDASLYAGLSADLIVADYATDQTKKLPMTIENGAFVVDYLNTELGEKILSAVVTGVEYSAETSAFAATFTNTPPNIIDGLYEYLRVNSENAEYNLNDYFVDSDGDALQFAIINTNGETKIAETDEGKFVFKPEIKGKHTISVQASDGRGGTATTEFSFEVVSWWVYYKSLILGVSIIFAVLLITYLIFILIFKKSTNKSAPAPQKSYASFGRARFEGYFLNTFSGKDVPVLYWNAPILEYRREISLGELFSIMDVDEKLPEANKIYFEASVGDEVIFRHDTLCRVTLGRRELEKGAKTPLRYDDKLYIVFEDGSTEIEVRYKRARARAIV